MRFLLPLLLAALALAGSARASDVRVASLPVVQDMSLPFWCDWSYDWEARCYRDDSGRIGVGGVGDKVWRAGLLFSLDPLPTGAIVISADLSLWFDGICVAPRRRTRPCGGTGFELSAHPIFTQRWPAQREVEIGPDVARAVFDPAAPPSRLVWDLTDLVAAWTSGETPNDGVLLKVADGDESLDSGGPAFPSSTFPNAAARPQLTVWYLRE